MRNNRVSKQLGICLHEAMRQSVSAIETMRIPSAGFNVSRLSLSILDRTG